MSYKHISLSVLIAGLSVATAAAVAAPGHTDDAGFKANSQAVFQALDSNHDNKLSAAEMTQLPQAMAKQRLTAMDRNNDGKIDKSEFEAAAKARADRRFAHMDRNQDGSLNADEMMPPKPPRGAPHDPAGPNTPDTDHAGPGPQHDPAHHGHHRGQRMPSTDEMFAHMDHDNDGFVSADEWQQAAAQWHHHKGPHHPGHGDNRPPHDPQTR